MIRIRIYQNYYLPLLVILALTRENYKIPYAI